MANILYCDPSNDAAVRFRFGDISGGQYREIVLYSPRAEQLLQQIHQLVQEEPIEMLWLVNRAYSFTMIRLLVTIFNSLAFAKQLPLYELTDPTTFANQVDHLIPHYLAEPNIT